MRSRRKLGELPPVYPNGWFIILESRELLIEGSREVSCLGMLFKIRLFFKTCMIWALTFISLSQGWLWSHGVGKVASRTWQMHTVLIWEHISVSTGRFGMTALNVPFTVGPLKGAMANASIFLMQIQYPNLQGSRCGKRSRWMVLFICGIMQRERRWSEILIKVAKYNFTSYLYSELINEIKIPAKLAAGWNERDCYRRMEISWEVRIFSNVSHSG